MAGSGYYNYSSPAYASYKFQPGGGDQPPPQSSPPNLGWYTDGGPTWQAKTDYNIGTTPYLQLITFDSQGNERDVSRAFPLGAFGKWKVELPFKTANPNYKIPDWEADINPGMDGWLRDELALETGDWKDGRLAVYQRIVGCNFRKQVAMWYTDTVETGANPYWAGRCILKRALRKLYRADGIDLVSDLSYESTLTEDFAQDCRFLSSNMEIKKDKCLLGNWTITFINDEDYEISGPNVDSQAGNIDDIVYVGGTSADKCQLVIFPDCWYKGFGQEFEADDEVTFSTTYTFKHIQRSDGYVYGVQAIYEALRSTGIEREQFDAPTNFPSEASDSVFSIDPEPFAVADVGASVYRPPMQIQLPATSWQWTMYMMQDVLIRLAITKTDTALSVAQHIGQHGPMWIYPDWTGKVAITYIGGFHNTPTNRTINSQTGLISASAPTLPEMKRITLEYAWSSTESKYGKLLLLPEYTDTESEETGLSAEETARINVKLKGYQIVDRALVEMVGDTWLLLNENGMKDTKLMVNALHACFYRIGGTYYVYSPQDLSHSEAVRMAFMGYTYDPNNIRIEADMLDWSDALDVFWIYDAPADYSDEGTTRPPDSSMWPDDNWRYDLDGEYWH